MYEEEEPVKVSLHLDLKVNLQNGETAEDVKRQLSQFVRHGLDRGLLTGELDSTLESHSSYITTEEEEEDLIPASEYKFLQDIELQNGEAVELWRHPGGGLFAVDASFMDQVSCVVYEPFQGERVRLLHDMED